MNLPSILSSFWMLLLASMMMPAIHAAPFSQEVFVTYSLSGGRLGDNLLAFWHAAWFAHEHQLPLVYQPFDFSNQLVLGNTDEILHQQEITYQHSYTLYHREQVLHFYKMASENLFPEKLLLCIPYYPDSLFEYDGGTSRGWLPPFMATNNQDPEFLDKMRRWIAPQNELKLLHPPEEVFSVALHIRGVGGAESSV